MKGQTSTSALKRFMNKDNTVGHVFAFPFIFGFVCFSLIPVCISFYYAFTNYSLGSKTAAFIGFKNFLRLFQDEVFLKSLAITLKYVLISVPLKLTFALLVAYLLTRPSRMVTFYRSLYYLPSLVGGSVAVALVWKQLFARKGLFNSVLANMDMSTINWFGNQKLALYPLILMSVWQFGSSMIIFAAGLKEIPVSYYEAARIDGARGYQSFFRITLPCLSPIILYNLIMQTISAFMAFTQAMIITNGGPNNSTMLYALYVYNQAFKYNDMGYACAMSWFMLVVMGLITFIIFKTSKFWVFSEANEAGKESTVMHNRKAVTKVLYHVFVILFGFMMVYPVLWMISGSFKGNAEILRGTLSLIPKELKLTNYATGWKGFGGTTFATFFTNSIFITVIATFGTVISSSLVAYALSRVRFRGRKFWFTCMLVTMMLPTQVIMIPQYLIYYRLGLVPGYVPLILPYFCGQAFFIYQMMQFMQGIPKDLDEAATIDGCSKYQIYSRIILPLMKPSIVTTVIIQFYWKWDDYMGPLLYLSRPQSYTVSIAIKLFADSASTTDYGAMFAMSTLSLIPVFLIFLFFNRYLVQGIGTSGLKG